MEAISMHEFPPSDFLIYRNLKPLLGYLKSNNHHAVQEWAIWAINILTQVEAANLKEQYIRLIIMHEGLVNIYDFIQATDTSYNVATVEKVTKNKPVISTGNNKKNVSGKWSNDPCPGVYPKRRDIVKPFINQYQLYLIVAAINIVWRGRLGTQSDVKCSTHLTAKSVLLNLPLQLIKFKDRSIQLCPYLTLSLVQGLPWSNTVLSYFTLVLQFAKFTPFCCK